MISATNLMQLVVLLLITFVPSALAFFLAGVRWSYNKSLKVVPGLLPSTGPQRLRPFGPLNSDVMCDERQGVNDGS